MNRRRFVRSISGLGLTYAVATRIRNPMFAASLPADITAFSASQLSNAIKDKQVSCAEVMQAYLQRIHRYNPSYNAIVGLVADDELMNQARQADQAFGRGEYWGWMHGMPHAAKDLTAVKGLLYTSGSPLFADRIADSDSQLVARIRAQGAIFIGKTNTPELGLGSQSYNPVFGATGSAYNPELTSGGSSGGAGCGLGTQMLPVADGSDMMGSLRNPGAFNNVIGFRPSKGRVPGGDQFFHRLSTGGPMGRNTEDTIRLLHSIAGPDPDQPLSLTDQLPPAEEFQPLNLNGVKLGWMGNLDNYLAMEPGILELCEANLSTLETAGAIIEPVLPDFDLHSLWQSWLDLRHWSRNGSREMYDNPETRAQLKPEFLWEMEQSFNLTAQDIYRAGEVRSDWYVEINRLLSNYDFLLIPTAQVFPFPKSIHWPTQINGREMDTYHRWMEVVIYASLAGIPACNVPVGFDNQGRPMGMQVIGRFKEDQKVLEFAMAYEQITDHLNRRPVL